MGRYRSRSRSLSPPASRSPPPRKRHDDSRRGGGGGDSYRGSSRSSYRDDRRSSGPSGLLIRNISLDARPEDLRIPFERFGPVKDVYLPKNYYTGEPKGFGFVKFRNADDAAEAKQQMNHQVIGGREITIVYAEENRKTPQEMRKDPHVSGRYGGGSRRRSPPRLPRRRNHSYSRSPSPARCDSRNRRAKDDSSPRKSISRSPSERVDRPNERSSPRDGERGDRSERRSLSTREERGHRTDQRSPSLRDERDYRSERRSASPLDDERGHMSKRRSFSPPKDDCRSDRISPDPPKDNGRSRSKSSDEYYRKNRSSPSPDVSGQSPLMSRDKRDTKGANSRSPSPTANSRSPSRSRSFTRSPR